MFFGRQIDKLNLKLKFFYFEIEIYKLLYENRYSVNTFIPCIFCGYFFINYTVT